MCGVRARTHVLKGHMLINFIERMDSSLRRLCPGMLSLLACCSRVGCLMVGWLVGWLVALFGWLLACLVDWWMIRRLICVCLLNWLFGWLFGWLFDWLVGWLVRHLVVWLIVIYPTYFSA